MKKLTYDLQMFWTVVLVYALVVKYNHELLGLSLVSIIQPRLANAIAHLLRFQLGVELKRIKEFRDQATENYYA